MRHTTAEVPRICAVFTSKSINTNYSAAFPEILVVVFVFLSFPATIPFPILLFSLKFSPCFM